MVSQRAIEGSERRRERRNARQREKWANATPEEHARLCAIQKAKNERWAARKRAGLVGIRMVVSAEVRALNHELSTKALRVRNKQFTDQYKMNHPCVDCGFADYRALDFDHRDRSEKFMSVSLMMKRAYKLDRIKEEIEKCDVRCANCHRIRSSEERHHLPVEQMAEIG